MPTFDNVKVLIQDKNKKYLVGRRYGKKYKYSTLGGHKEKNESILQTMKRELLEETSGVLKITQGEGDKYYISDGKYKYLIKISDVVQVGKQIYVMIYFPYSMSEHIQSWKKRFHENQKEILMDKVQNLTDRYPDIPVLQWIEHLIKYKQDYSNVELETILHTLGFSKSEIKRLIKEFEDIGYYLEMDDLDVVSLRDINALDGLYERNLVNML
jgi:8-oxo-dGTP pyrophosphatase MutT (NUDIX family)